jgi:Co/Zn/Cd efflux system component
MEGAPEAIKVADLEQELKNMDDVAEVKELHVWSLSRGKHVCVVKLVAKHDPQAVLLKATKKCRDFGVETTTIQV